MIKKIILWVLVISCATAIFLFSAQKADDSGRASEGFTYKIIKFFDFNDKIPDESAMEFAISVNGIVRKIAHFSIYALLGFLIAQLLNEYGRGYRKILMLSVMFSSLYACTDEIHQYFVPAPSAQITDVILVTFRALFGSLIVIGIIALIKNRKASK